MAKKTCPIRSNVCNREACMFWEGAADADADGCLIVRFFGNFTAQSMKNLDALVKLAGRNPADTKA